MAQPVRGRHDADDLPADGDRGDHGADGVAVADRLAQRDDVGDDFLGLEAPEVGPDPPVAGLDLVGDAAAARLAHRVVGAGQVAGGQDDLAAHAGQRLGEECGRPRAAPPQAVDDLAEEMMSRYNRSKAIVFTTLQLYRWDRNDYFLKLVQRARAEGYKLGIKIVPFEI